MANAKKKQEYPVREPTANDCFDLIGILAAAGGGEQIGAAVGFAISAYQSGERELLPRAISTAITDGLNAALRDAVVREEVKTLLFRLWNPKLSVDEGETLEENKREAWKKLPMRAVPELIDSFRRTDGFADFLAYFTDMLPKPETTENPANAGNPATNAEEKASGAS